MATPGPYQQAVRADELWLLTLMMSAIGLLTAIKWQSLFPGLRDYRVLGTLPLRARQIFQAKFLALLIVSATAVVVIDTLPCLTFPLVSGGRWQINPSLAAHLLVQAIAFAAACYFFFFGMLALQGVLLNLLPPRRFGKVTGYLQGLLVAVMLILIVLSFSIDTRFLPTALRPELSAWLPPVWFLGLYQNLLGDPDPLMAALAQRAEAASRHLRNAGTDLLHRRLPAPPQAAGGGRHRLVHERSQVGRRASRVGGPQPAPAGRSCLHDQNAGAQQPAPHDPDGLRRRWPGHSAHRHSGNAGSRSRARPHRGLLRVCSRNPADIPADRPAPPVHHPSRVEGQLDVPDRRALGRLDWMRAVDRFILFWGAALMLAVPFPLEVHLLGWRAVAEAAIFTAFGLLCYEWVFTSWQKLPFTCSHLSGKIPAWILTLWGIGILAAFPMVNGLLLISLYHPVFYVILFGAIVAIWLGLYSARRQGFGERLTYDDLPDPAIHGLNLLP